MEIWDVFKAALELLLAVLGYLRLAFRRTQSRSWPVASGTVQACGVERGVGFWAPFRYRSLFGYAFRAKGSRYAGFFALATDDEDSAEALQKETPGTTVTVRYKSDNPDVSLLEEGQILGRRIMQNPHWLP